MFMQFYGIREQPFGVTPDCRYIHFSRTHREALASLFCGIQDRRGFLALIAPPGTGKTTLLFYLLERLRGSSRTVFIFDKPSEPQDLMSCLAADLGLNAAGLTTADIRRQFHNLLTEEARAGKNFVVVVDEAQNLPNSVLEELRMLSNFESGTHKLLQVVLAGQPSLATRLAHPDLVQLRQRLAIVTGLEPLTHEEVCAYIEYRLSVAGGDSESLFTQGALALVASESKGIPRSINIICYNALALGCAQKRKRIDVRIIKQVTNDLALENVSGEMPGDVADGRARPTAEGQIRAHNDSTVHTGTRKRDLAGVTSDKMPLPSVLTLTKVTVGIAALLIVISILVIALSRRGLDLTSPARLNQRTTAATLTAPAPTTIPPAESVAFIHDTSFVTNIRYRSESTSTTVGIELEGPVQYQAHRLISPDRVYLDLYGSKLAPVLLRKRLQINDKIVRKVRIAQRTETLTRVTLETYDPCDFSVSVSGRSELLVQLRGMEQQLNIDASLHNNATQPSD